MTVVMNDSPLAHEVTYTRNTTSFTISYDDLFKFATVNDTQITNLNQKLALVEACENGLLPPALAPLVNDFHRNKAQAFTISRMHQVIHTAKQVFASSKTYYFIITCIVIFGLYKIFKPKPTPAIISEKSKAKRRNLNKTYGKNPVRGIWYVKGGRIYYDGDEDFDVETYNDLVYDDMDDFERYNAGRTFEDQFWDDYDMPDNYGAHMEKASDDIGSKQVWVKQPYLQRLKQLQKNGRLSGLLIQGSGFYKEVRITDADGTQPLAVRAVQQIQFKTFTEMIQYDAAYTNYGFASLSELRDFFRKAGMVTMLRVRNTRRILGVCTLTMMQMQKGKRYFKAPKIMSFENDYYTNSVFNIETATFFSVNWKVSNDSKVDATPFCHGFETQTFEVVSIATTQMIRHSARLNTPTDLLIQKIKQNAVRVLTNNGAVGGFYIAANTILTVAHVGSDNITIQCEEHEQTRDIPVVRTIIHPSRDLQLVITATTPQGCKNLLKYLTADVPGTVIRTTIGCLANEPALNAVSSLSYYNTECSDIVLKSKEYFRSGLMKINGVSTQAGDCGRPYIEDCSEPKIFGIHSAASVAESFASAIDIKWIKYSIPINESRDINIFERLHLRQAPCIVKQTRYSIPEFKGEIEVIGMLPVSIKSPDTPYSFESPLRKYYQHLIPNMKGPAKTSVTELTIEEKDKMAIDKNGNPDFYLGQILQYNDPIVDFSPHRSSQFAKEWFAFNSLIFLGNRPGSVLTTEEILNGITKPTDPLRGHCNSMNWNGAIGYSVSRAFDIHRKGDIVFREDETSPAQFNDTDASHYIQTRFAYVEEQAKKGKFVPELLQDNLKQENRVNEKRYKQRVFTSYPMVLSMLVRKYMLRFLTCFTKYHQALFQKVGINTAAEFHLEMMRQRCFAGPNARGFGFDLGRCDKHMSKQFINDVFGKIFKHFIVNEHRRRECNCGEDTAQHLIIADVVIRNLYDNFIASQDVVYHKTRGNSSGSDCTTVLNSVYLEYLLYMFYVKIAKQNNFGPDYHHFREHVLAMLCGDDGKVCVSEGLLASGYDFVAFKQYMAEHGIVVDTPLKDGSEPTSMPIEDIPFISREWVLLEQYGVYSHKFKLEILSGHVYWTTDYSAEHLADLIKQILTLAVPYGREFYNGFLQSTQNLLEEQPHFREVVVCREYAIELEGLARQVHGLAISQMCVPCVLTPEKQRNLNEMTSSQLYLLQQLRLLAAWLTIDVSKVCFFFKYSRSALDQLYKDKKVYEFNGVHFTLDPTIPSEVTILHYPFQDSSARGIFDMLSNLNKAEGFSVYEFQKQHYLMCDLKKINTEPLGIPYVAPPPDQIEHESLHDMMSHIVRTRKPQNQMLPMMGQQQPQQQMAGNKTYAQAVTGGQGKGGIIPGAGISALVEPIMTRSPHLDTVDQATMPVMSNMFANSTIPMPAAVSTRTDGLPNQFLAYGGVTENIQDVALGSFQLVRQIQVPVNATAGTPVFKIPYGIEMLGGYARDYANLHCRMTGSVAVKLRIVTNAINQGLIRMCWRPRSNWVINLQDSSTYGAVDLDAAISGQEFSFVVHPVAGDTGRFYFDLTKPPPEDQACLYFMLLTDLINNYSDIGKIQIIVESRPYIDFAVAEPRSTLTPTTNEVNLLEQAARQGMDLTQFTIALDSNLYPKYESLLTYADMRHEVNTARRVILGLPAVVPQQNPATPYVPSIGISNSSPTHEFNGPETHLTVNSDWGTHWVGADYSAGRSYSLDYGGNVPTGLITSLPNGAGGNVQQARLDRYTPTAHIISLASNGGSTKMSSGCSVTITDQGRQDNAENDTAVLPVALYDPSTARTTFNISDMFISTTLDNSPLPANQYIVDFIDTEHPTVSLPLATASNTLIPCQFTAFLQQHAKANCPTNGLIKYIFTASTSNSAFFEFYYKPDTGFATITTDGLGGSRFFSGNISTMRLTFQVFEDQSLPTLYTNLTNFTSILSGTGPRRKRPRKPMNQMFALAGLGGLFGGLAQNSQFNKQLQNQREMLQMSLGNQKDITGMNIDNQQALAKLNLTGQFGLQQLDQQFRARGNNFMHSPQGAASVRKSVIKPGTDFVQQKQQQPADNESAKTEASDSFEHSYSGEQPDNFVGDNAGKKLEVSAPASQVPNTYKHLQN